MIFYFVAISSLVTVMSVYGQRTVTGRIVDKETGKPIKDAQVLQLETNIRTATNALGFFQLQVDSTSSIEIEATDYQLVQIEVPNANSFRVELEKIAKPTEEIFYVIEEPASFPGGISKFYDYLNTNMKVPKEVRNGTISGRVLVEFVIEATGQIPPDEVKVRQGLCKSCDEEAVRLIKESPNWNPGLQKGKPVPQRMVVPIIFK